MKRLIAYPSVSLLMAALVLGPPLVSVTEAHSDHKSKSARSFVAGEPGDVRKPFRTVVIVMKDAGGSMSYAPDRIEVKKGEQIKFLIRNEGVIDHEFLLDSVANNARHKAEMEKDPDMAHEEPNGARLKPTANHELLWHFSKAGTFEFACLLPGHYESGMKGMVVVK
ncbi:MAG TPA: cupredoxin family protein [Hyphomicrobiaceae bacterium]|nr:cupredoxin family protein [Hyphomicrobiaceae bacterium]